MTAEKFAAQLRVAEDRLRASGLSGRSAYAALCRHLAERLGLPTDLWLDGPDAPESVGLESLPLTAELDLFGLAYERFFPEVFKGERGQYFTPRPLVELMADLAGLRPGERVLDPTCGSGSFIVLAHNRGCDVDGIEIDPELVALCRLNLKLHGANPRAVRRGDLFREAEDDAWDVILANPPFSVEIDHPDALRRFALAAGRARVVSDELFVEAAWRRLRPGGRLAAVLPHSVLANPRFGRLREWIDERFVRVAIISLPEGVFRPFGGAASRACVVVLRKRPAPLEPWVAAIIRHPGYDPKSKVFRRREPDEIALLRIALRQGEAKRFDPDRTEWLPERLLLDSGLGEGVSVVALGELAPVRHTPARPSDSPDARFTEIDLADVDKQTGEVTGARARLGREFAGHKSCFVEGDVLFARIRPNLNNVVIASRPALDLPESMCGSSEWVRLCPPERPYFALVAARSSFVKAQLRATGGQTRPRVRAEDLSGIEVPDPGDQARELIDRLVGEAHAQRRAARIRMDRVAALYEAFGRGEIDEEQLLAELSAMS